MFKNLHLWANIMLGMVIAMALAVGGLTWSSLHNLHQVIGDAERAELRQISENMQLRIAEKSEQAESMAQLVANLPIVQSRFADQDRAWLREFLLPVFERLARDHGVVQFQFHLPPARSFLRLHKLDTYGDDLSSFRLSVVDANRTLEPQRGLELGVAGLGARGVVPVFDQGQHLGTVEFGMSFGQSFFDEFERKYGVDGALYLREGDGFQVFASTHGDQPLLSEKLLEAAFAGEAQLEHVSLEGRPTATYLAPVLDYSGRPIGVLEVAQDRSHYRNITRDAWLQAGIVGVLALLLSLVIAQLSARSLGSRIRDIAHGVNRVAAGDLSQPILIHGNDELAELAQAAETMRHGLSKLVAEVEDDATRVHAAAREIAQAVDSQAANSSEMSASMSEITSTMEELSASSTQIAEYSESVVGVAKRTLDESRGGAESMQHLVERMGEISRDNEQALAEIVELGDKSKEISRVMEIINAVADQTKLIAFNAALEASSAGDAGKRFGVVAAEIRRLADSVTESTGEIEQKVNEIQATIARLVVTSEKGSSGIREGMDESSQTAKLLSTMVDGAGETNNAAQQINLSSQQQKTASGQVVEVLRDMVTTTSDTADAVRRIAEIATDMTAISATLEERVERFRLERAQAEGEGAGDGPGGVAGDVVGGTGRD